MLADAGVCTYRKLGSGWDVVANDNCTYTLSYTLSGATTASVTSNTLAGQIFNLGSTTVTWKVKDASNNVQTCSFSVTVTDTEKPVFACP